MTARGSMAAAVSFSTIKIEEHEDISGDEPYIWTFFSKLDDDALYYALSADEIIKAADLVTEMNEIKHPYQQGIKAKRGIDY